MFGHWLTVHVLENTDKASAHNNNKIFLHIKIESIKRHQNSNIPRTFNHSTTISLVLQRTGDMGCAVCRAGEMGKCREALWNQGVRGVRSQGPRALIRESCICRVRWILEKFLFFGGGEDLDFW